DMTDAVVQADAVPAEVVVSTNEPFWNARVEGSTLQLSGPDLEQPRRMALDAGEAGGAGTPTQDTRRFFARDAQGTVELQVMAQRGQDSMSGAWYPLAATVSVDGARAAAGCARPSTMPAPGEMP